jgi:hypothetical protein
MLRRKIATFEACAAAYESQGDLDRARQYRFGVDVCKEIFYHLPDTLTKKKVGLKMSLYKSLNIHPYEESCQQTIQ